MHDLLHWILGILVMKGQFILYQISTLVNHDSSAGSFNNSTHALMHIFVIFPPLIYFVDPASHLFVHRFT